ncbi:MAG: hypothetical protein LBI05_09375 [Planctomycetaceae bacterium]|nr:hypothetical protein [Planctomycetaceae bacterium]
MIWCDWQGDAALQSATVVDGIYGFGSLPFMVGYAIFYVFYLLRLWKEVPRPFARTTPEAAAWLSIIPVFGWYWMFVALGGLYQDMNKTLQFYGQSKRFNTTLIFVACVLWLFIDLFALMLVVILSVVSLMPDPGPFMVFSYIVEGVVSVFSLIFTVVMYGIICKNVREFVDLKAK